jgi:hypothetical protein
VAGSEFTFIGSLDDSTHGRLSSTGQFQPADHPWSLDWWIGTGERWYKPAEAPSVRQSRPGSGPVVDTRMRIGQADVVCRVFGVASPKGSDVVIELTNEAKAPVALAIVLRQVDLENRLWPGSAVVIDDEAMLVSGQRAVIFDRPPSGVEEVDGLDLTPEQAQRVAIFPLLHSATVRLVVPAEPGSPMRTLPEGDAVVRGWDTVVERNGRVIFGDDSVTNLAGAARARLLLAVPGLGERVAALEPGAGRILEALATSASANDVVRSLQAFAAGFCVWLPGAPSDAAAVMSGIGAAAQLLDDKVACGELVEPAAQLTHLVERSGDGVAGREALAGLSKVLLAAGHLEPAAEIAMQIAGWDGHREDIPSGLAAVSELGQTAGEAGSFGSDDAAVAARYWLGARGLVVNERPGKIELLPQFASAWRGGSLEAHNLTVAGSDKASFAVRWHAYRPALLWDVQTDDSMVLTCPALDPDWSTTTLKGEVLLAGTAEGLVSVPAPGDSFS